MYYKYKYRDEFGKSHTTLMYVTSSKENYDYLSDRERRGHFEEFSRRLKIYCKRVRKCRKENLFI